MLKSSSLFLYSSNLGTFWLKIEQFWPFEEISIFSNSGHLGWRPGSSNTILKGDHLMTIPPKFGPKWPSSIRGEDFYLIFLLNFIFLVTADKWVGGRGHRTEFWKGTTKAPFHQSLVQIGPVASEELIKMWKVNGRMTDNRCSVVTIAHLTLWVRWAKNGIYVKLLLALPCSCS